MDFSMAKLVALLTVFVYVALTTAHGLPKDFRSALRYKRQFDENIDPSLQQTIQNIQQNQQQRPNRRPTVQQGGQQQRPSNANQQIPSWTVPNSGGGSQQGGLPWTTQRTPVNQINIQNNVVDQATQCVSRCPVTSEWNPVCGTDSLTYQNMNKLRCAQQCGRQVSFVYNGSCVTTPATSSTTGIPSFT